MYGQSAWTIYNQQNSPLPQNTVRCLTVDKSGNIWAGTDYGLAKFDGQNWTIYQTFNSQLPDNNIRALAADTQGAVWIGTQGSGLVKFINNTWTIYNSSNSGLPGNFIRTITFDKDGNIWVGGSAGLSTYNGSTWTSWTNTNSPLISHHIASVAVGDDNTKYLGTINGGMVFFKDTTFTFYNHWNGTLPDNTILSVCLDTAGAPWMGMPSGGVSVNYGPGVWQGFMMANSTIPSDAINAVFIDSLNKVYVGSQDKGIVIRQGFDFIHFDSLNSDLPDVNVLSIVKDIHGKLWMGTMYGGLARLDETMAVKDEKTLKALKVNPNILGRNDLLTIQSLRDVAIVIYDLQGKRVRQIDIRKGYNQLEPMLPSGGYILKPIGLTENHKLFIVD